MTPRQTQEVYGNDFTCFKTFSQVFRGLGQVVLERYIWRRPEVCPPYLVD